MKNKVSVYFLRGIIRESAHWGTLPSELEGQFPHWRTLFLNIAGAGQWYRLRSFWGLKQQVEFLRRQYLQLQAAQPTGEKRVLVAISLGGMVADAWARQYPEDWDQLILINTSMAGLNPFWQRLNPKLYPKLLSALLSWSAHGKQEKIFQATCCPDQYLPQRREETIQTWVKIQQQRPVSLSNALRQLWSATTYRSQGKAPHPNTTLLVGDRDQMVSPKCSKTLAQRWKVPLISCAQAAHDLPLDQRPWFLQQLKELIDGR